MSIYEKPVRLLFEDMIEALSFATGNSVRRQEIVNWFAEKYPKIKPNTVTAHLTKMTTNDRSRKWHTVDPAGSHDIFYKIRPGLYRLYDAATDPPPIYLTSADVQTSAPESRGTSMAGTQGNHVVAIIIDREELDRRRWFLIRLLKAVDESEEYDSGVGSKVGRLRRERKIPRHIAGLIFVLLDYRNVVGYEGHELKDIECRAIDSAWNVIIDWARGRGLLNQG